MADETKTPLEAPAAIPKTKAGDRVSEIGTLTYSRAVQHFGKDQAVSVMQKVAEIGGHGLFDENDLTSPLFGGLAMPSPETVIKPVKENFAHLPESDFYYQSALEDYEVLKEQAAANRAAINDLYSNLK